MLTIKVVLLEEVKPPKTLLDCKEGEWWLTDAGLAATVTKSGHVITYHSAGTFAYRGSNKHEFTVIRKLADYIEMNW